MEKWSKVLTGFSPFAKTTRWLMLLLKVHCKTEQILKLDGVGPVDNRPSTDKLQRFVCKKLKNKNM